MKCTQNMLRLEPKPVINCPFVFSSLRLLVLKWVAKRYKVEIKQDDVPYFDYRRHSQGRPRIAERHPIMAPWAITLIKG